MATRQEALAHLTRLTDDLRARQPDVLLFDEYYRGLRSKLKYASDQFRDYFARRYQGFSDNWTQVVADAPHERLKVTGIRPAGSGSRETDMELWEDWKRNEADYESGKAFLEATIGKRAYALVWGDEDDSPVITWEHPSQAIVNYDPEHRVRRSGLKMWVDDDTNLEFATLYLPDSVWKWQRLRITEGRTQSGLHVPIPGAGGWEPRQPEEDDTWPLPNPLGEVPLAELQNRPRLLGEPMSDIAGAAAMQDAINLLWAYLFNAADYGSFPQRVVTGAERPKIPILNDQGDVVGHRPVDLERFAIDRVAWIEDPNARTSEWSAASLETYTNAMEVAVSHLAAQSRTPPHYMLLGQGLVNVSAEGMKVAETGLAQRSQEKTENYGRGVRDVFRLCARVRGDESKADAVSRGSVTWADVESRSEAQVVDAAQKLRQMGFPLEWIARARLRLPPEEVNEVMEMIRRDPNPDPVSVLMGGDQSSEVGE